MTAPMPVPTDQSIFHITHVDNLPAMLAGGGLQSDRAISAVGGPAISIGMSVLKGRRFDIEVPMHRPLMVADFVPFYFCARSVMLSVIWYANHPELAYRGGQGPILHLRFDLREVVRWAQSEDREWAFTLQNATAAYAQFRNQPNELQQVNWRAMPATDWRDPVVKEARQSEFLVRDFVPFDLVEEIGVRDLATHIKVTTLLSTTSYSPAVNVRPEWYY